MRDEIKVAIIEDQKHAREGLAALIDGTSGYRTVGHFASMEEALSQLEQEIPDVILMDIQLPGMNGIEGVRIVKSRHPGIQILMLTVFADNDYIFEAICAGACGYLLKDTRPTRLLEAIRELHGGGAPMSPEIARQVVTMFHKVAPPKNQDYQLSAREVQVLKLLADGHSYKTAAAELGVSLDTLRFHIRNIYEKLHVHSKSEAVLQALRNGILSY